MTRQHRADKSHERQISRAVGFTAHARNGPGDARTISCGTLGEARAAADRLERTYCAPGRRAGVYAVTPERYSIFVPRDYAEDTMAEETTNNVAGTEAANSDPMARTWTNPSAARSYLRRHPVEGAKVQFDQEAAAYRLVIANDDAKADEKAGAETEAKAETKADTGEKVRRMSATYRAALEAAQKGVMPNPPDFTANTHKPYRKKLDALVKAANEGDIVALEAIPINPISTSPKAMQRYRELAITAIRAREGAAA